MLYPGRIVRRGERNEDVLHAVITTLNESMPADCKIVDEDIHGVFDRNLEKAVEYFQARHCDIKGMPLKQDGEIGPITWAALFGSDTIRQNAQGPGAQDWSELREAVIQVAEEELGRNVREVPWNSNRGPDVEKYLKSVGLPGGYAWCCAFLYWNFMTAAQRRHEPAVRMIKTAGCLDHWRKAREQHISTVTSQNALDDPTVVKRGSIFVMDHGKGLGHTGIVTQAQGGFMTTIEGNTDGSKTREGGGVYLLQRKLNEVNVGFINYFA